MPHCSLLDPWWRARDRIPNWCWFSERDFLPTCFSKIPQERVWGYIFSFITLGTQWDFSVWTLLFFNSGKFIMSLYVMPSAWFYFYWLLVLYWTYYVVPSGPLLFHLCIQSLLLLFSPLGDFLYLYSKLHWLFFNFSNCLLFQPFFVILWWLPFLIKPYFCLAEAIHLESLTIQNSGVYFLFTKKVLFCSMFSCVCFGIFPFLSI